MSMKENLSEVVTYTFVWHIQPDACPKCRALNGIVARDQDLFASVLIGPYGSSIWDLDADRSLMHGGVGTCRCGLEVIAEVDLSKASWFQDILNTARKVS